MIQIENYMKRLIDLLKYHFKARLLYVGLQGSYMRGEATESSDTDVMVVIDGLDVCDLDTYRKIVSSLESYDRSCGFICSKDDLINWNPLEIFGLINGTKDYYGKLEPLVPAYTKTDIQNFVKFSINSLYHGICHSYVHADVGDVLKDAYKNVFFILQNLYYLESGKYIATKAELLPLLEGRNHIVLKNAIDSSYDFSDLFTWCQKTLCSL